MRGPIHLSELAPIVGIVCEQCNRRGMYQRDKLLARLGNIVAPEVLVTIARDRGCKIALQSTDWRCRAHYTKESVPQT